MKFKYIIPALALGLAFTACDDDDDNYGVLDGLGMVKRETSIADGATIRANSISSITISYNNLVGIDASKSITLNGTTVAATVNPDNGMEVLIPVSLEAFTTYTLTVPQGAIYRSDDATVTADAITLSFDTNTGINPALLSTSLTNSSATSSAKALYQYLYSNYGNKMLSGAMGAVAWDTEYIDFLAGQIGVYPKIVGFDYIHLASSPANWIDYGDITPVKNIYEAGSYPAMSWHWNVPTSKPGEFTLYEGELAIPGDWSGYLQLDQWNADAMAVWSQVTIGTVITVNIKDCAEGAQGSFKDCNWSGLKPAYEYFDISGDSFSMTVTSDNLSDIVNGGIIISGHDYTITSVVVTIPSGSSLSYNTTAFSASNVMIDGTWENSVAEADVAKLAGYLQLLQDAGIPVLWRPFHEAAGDYTWGAWFWWGYEGVSVTKQLWIWLYDKLTNEYGLNNLIWVWTMQTTDAGALANVSQLQAAYPGDQYVDIVGVDLYPSSVLTDQSDAFLLAYDAVGGKKIITLSECGNLIDPVAAYDNAALWSYFMQWYDMDDNGNFGFNYYTGPDQWQTVVYSPYVINR